MDIEETSCCGLRELSDLSDTIADNVRTVWEDMKDHETFYPHVFFTDAYARGEKASGTNGYKLAQLIEKNKLGVITASPAKINPNSGNKLVVWVWTVDKKALVAHFIGEDDEEDWE
jgi:hypothetical protein